jgi:hypothetical protein
MNRRDAILLALFAGLAACKRREKVRVEPVDENSPEFASSIHVADPQSAHQLARGFHPVEQNAWRWTEGSFAVALAVPPAADREGGRLILQFSVPEAVINRLETITLTARIGGQTVGSSTYDSAGEVRFESDVAPELLKAEVVTVEFQLRKFLAAGTVDQRELGLVVSSATLETK